TASLPATRTRVVRDCDSHMTVAIFNPPTLQPGCGYQGNYVPSNPPHSLARWLLCTYTSDSHLLSIEPPSARRRVSGRTGAPQTPNASHQKAVLATSRRSERRRCPLIDAAVAPRRACLASRIRVTGAPSTTAAILRRTFGFATHALIRTGASMALHATHL